ncbi:uncharacterized protein K02A2.6-like [Acyrthosiphon pisum]|uniref:RNA-directed DNA polymerase n=1 Tax=Acyrthosiphon pisum TaxID=7029 RepID=A0A8R1X0T5_ACYPI|nr:uncharacterized protein K02A2.6-like [Acyrthosiphon pisum]|eukprot:XP_008179051.1 PREDICTED: uncharacterized protein K02A2.6-like [Acyrthosiphon pisum]
MTNSRNSRNAQGGNEGPTVQKVQTYGTMGTLAEFRIDGDWNVYQERMEQFFLANGIPEERKVPLLITCMGEQAYKMLKDLCDPIKPADRTYEQLCTVLTRQFAKKVSVYRKREEFYNIRQNTNEFVTDWYAKMKNFAAQCSFGSNLIPVLKDKFTTGMKDGPIKDRLYEEETTKDLSDLVEIAMKKEAAIKTTSNIEVHSIGKSREGAKKKNIYGPPKKPSTAMGVEENEVMEMFQVEVKSENNCGLSPVMIMVKVENTLIEMEVDSGAGISILPEEVVKEKLPHIHINPTILKLRTYDGSIIKLTGGIEVKLMYGERELCGKLLVVKKGHRALVGRDLMNKLGITIRGISKIEVESTNKNNKLELLINEFEELFEEKIGKYKYEKVTLKVKEECTPIFCKPRQIPFAFKKKVEDELDRLEREEIIQKVETSEWGTLLVPVIKPDGSIRLCADYKTTVNKYLVDINHPLPRVEEVFVALQGGKTFSKLDFLNAYNQLQLCESTQKLLAWSTSKGIYIDKRLPFGTKPACSKFQSVIEKVLLGTKGVKNFLDDIIVTGHIIGSEGIERDQNKVKAMLNAVEPKSVTEVKAFTGPIHNLLKKEVKFVWTSECRQAFNKTKQAMASESLLVHYNSDLSVVLSCDASEYGIGAVLMHIFENGERRPVEYASRILTVAKKKILETDHKPLLALYGENKDIPVMASGRIQRWALYLSEFDYQVLHVKSNDNKVADGLSRLPDKHDVQTQTNETDYVDFMENTMPIYYEILRVKTKKDKEFNLVIKYLNEGWSIKVSEKLKPYAIKKEEICVDKDILMCGYRILIPKILRKNLLKEVHSTHMGMSKMKTLCRSYMWWPGLDKDIENWVQSCDACLQSRSEPILAEPNINSKILRKNLLKEVHSTHMGMSKMKTLCRSYMWWPGLDKDIENWVQSCDACLQSRSEPILAEPKKWEEASYPMDRVHIDFLYLKGKDYLIMTDIFTKWQEVAEMKVSNSGSVIEKLREIFARFGLPNKIVSDNGPQFRSEEFIQFCKNNMIKFVTSPPYHPATDGSAENAVKSLKNNILKAVKDKTNKNVSLNTLIQRYLLTYRNTPHWITGESPSYRMFGRKIKTRLDKLCISKETNKYIKRFRKVYFKEGDIVYARDYSNPNKKEWKKGTIEEVIGERIYIVRLEKENLIWRRHIDQLIEVGKIKENGIETVEKEKREEQTVLKEKKIIKEKGETMDKKNFEIEKSEINEGLEEEVEVSLSKRSKRNRKKPDRLNL